MNDKLKKIFACGKPWYKKWWVYVIAVLLVVIILAIPFVINEVYKYGIHSKKAYKTMWGADDVLAFYGSFLAFLGTVSLGVLALWQNKKANEINMRILKIEEISNVPYLNIDRNATKISCLSENEINIIISLRNTSKGIINLASISDMNYDFPMNSDNIVPNCKEWNEYYTILPSQNLEINFIKEIKKGDSKFEIPWFNYKETSPILITCNFNVMTHFVNSKEKYKQQYKFTIVCIKSSDKDFSSLITDIENSIDILEEK